MRKTKRKRSLALRKGDIVECIFHDHVEDGDEAINFTVWGRIVKVSKLSYKIESWAYTDAAEGERDTNPENVKTFTIVKKAILKITRLRRG